MLQKLSVSQGPYYFETLHSNTKNYSGVSRAAVGTYVAAFCNFSSWFLVVGNSFKALHLICLWEF